MADPFTIGAMALTGIGGGLQAAGTIAGGNAAATAGRLKQEAANSQAQQEESNAAGELAASQRRMLDTRMKTRLLQGTLANKAAASGFDASEGSMLTDATEIAQRGEYQALMDVFSGENARTGLLNKAAATRFSGEADRWAGEQAKSASYLAAAGTIAGTAGSMFKTYGSFKYPTPSRAYG